MKDTQVVNVLVGLEPDLSIEEVKKNGKIVIKYIGNDMVD